MLNWENRPFEIAYLINPAFCALVLSASIGEFSKEKHRGMPYALAFLILPLILHEPTRNSLPNDTRETLIDWFKEQREEFGVIFVHQVRQFVPYTRESLLFGMQRSVLQVDEDGSLINGTKSVRKIDMLSPSLKDLFDSSRFVGRWFSKSEHERFIFKTFGICL